MNRHLEPHSLGVKVVTQNAYGEDVTRFLDNGTINAWICEVSYEELTNVGLDLNDVSHLILTDTVKRVERGDYIDCKYEVKKVVVGHKYTKLYSKLVEEEESIELNEIYEDGYDDGWRDGYEEGSEHGGGGAKSWDDLEDKPFETIGQNLKVVDGSLTVDTANAVEADNTKPITSAAVHVEVGNINTLLQTI